VAGGGTNTLNVAVLTAGGRRVISAEERGGGLSPKS